MYHPCIASIVSVRTRGLHSFSSNENPYCSNERYPFICSPRVYCSCCCSSMYRVPLSSSYCYSLGGARQSSLIQWAPCRKLVLRGFDPCFHTRLPASNVCRSCCCDKVCSFREKSEGGSKQRLRKSMVFEEMTERNDFEIANEAEVVLDLLSEGIGEECLHVTRDARRVLKKAAVVEKANSEFRNKHWYKEKGVDVGILENDSNSVNGSLLISRKKGGGREEMFVREDEEGYCLRKENSRQMLKKEHEHTFLTTERVRKQNEREVLLKEKSHGNKEIQESESKLRNEMNVRARTEEREELLRRKEDRQKLRKDGSSCSSYYSLSSTGDYDSDNDIEHGQAEYTRDSSSGLERSSRSTEALNREVKEDKMREDYREEHGINVTKKRSEKELYTGSSIVESGFRKKSEKKLTDVSVKEIESRKNNLQKEANSLQEQESNYRKSSDYPVKYDDRKEKSTRSTKFDEQAVDAVSVQSERKLKYKQLLDIQKTQDIDVQNSYFLNTYSGKHDSKVVSQETAGEHVSVIGISTRTDEHQSSSTHVAEVSESQKIDVSKTSVSHQRFEEHSANFSPAEKDAVKQHHGNEQVSGMVALWRESELLSKKQSKSGLKSSDEIITQDQNVDLASGSTVLSADLSSQAHTGVLKTGQSIMGSDKTTKISRTQSSIEHVVDRAEDGQPVGQTSVRISHEDLTAAARFEKSSAHHVDEFVDQVRHEISSSGIKKETKTRTAEIMHEGKQFQKKVVPFTSGDSKAKEQHSPGDDLFSGAAGPSDEMWKLNETSTKKQSKEDVQDDAIKAGDIVIKRTGRSLWNVLVDVFRLGWSPRSENRHSGRNSVGKSPNNQSTRSETWFSTRETEENEEASRDREGLSKDHQGEKIGFPVEECSSPSASEGRLKLQEGNAMTISPLTTISLPSAEEISGGNSVATSSPVMIDSSTSSPTSGGRYQVIQGMMEVGESNASSSTSMLNTGLVELSESTVNEGKLKSGKLQRKDQIPRDRFDEWEEAYNIEAEQRKTDESFMREAIREAQKAADNWEVPVGAVLVHDGKIIARGCNLVEQQRDSTAHAEMICIREASKILRTWRLSETQLYVTLEPCPMCAGAILQARIDTIVWGAPNKLLGADGSWIRLFPSGDGGNGLEHSDKPPAPVHPFHPKIRIRRGVLASECADTMQQFFKSRRKRKDNKSESPSPPPSCLPLSNRPSRFLAKMHDAFSLMFYL